MAAVTHVRDEMQEGVAAQRADGERHQEAEEELEENSVHERDEDDSDQREQADDGDGQKPADPRCATHQIKHLQKKKLITRFNKKLKIMNREISSRHLNDHHKHQKLIRLVN